MDAASGNHDISSLGDSIEDDGIDAASTEVLASANFDSGNMNDSGVPEDGSLLTKDDSIEGGTLNGGDSEGMTDATTEGSGGSDDGAAEAALEESGAAAAVEVAEESVSDPQQPQIEFQGSVGNEPGAFF